MKKIFLSIAIILSITTCTKSETANPEPEPASDTTSKSYVGCMRSDYPDITIPGISVNGKIIYDLKSACSFSGPTSPTITRLYSGRFTYLETVTYNIFPIVEIVTSSESDNIYIYISKEKLGADEIKYELHNEEEFYKTDNIKSVNIKETAVILDNEYFKTDICRFDIEITLQFGNVIEIVYYGESIHQYIIGGIK
jgi:hypothetical protein